MRLFQYLCWGAMFSLFHAPAFGVEPSQCEALNKLSFYQTKLNAQYVGAGIIPADPNSSFTGTTARDIEVGAHCLVQGEIEPRKGSDGKSYAINFQLRLPDDWNGKFMFQGGGGANGYIAPALGSVPSPHSSAVPALLRGYAVVSMDSGHQGKQGAEVSDVAFAQDQQARLDFAYQAIGKVTERAKQLIFAQYQKKPKHSYYMGCSNGGREAMLAAQRYPTEFDGVIAGNAAFRANALLVAARNYQLMREYAKANGGDENDLRQIFSDDDLAIIKQGVLARCDGKDGLKDGLVNAWESCDFNPDMLEGKLDGKKIALLKALFSPMTNSDGKEIYPAMTYHPSVDNIHWKKWWFGLNEAGRESSEIGSFVMPLLLQYYMQPNGADVSGLNLENLPQIDIMAGLTNADSTGLSTFKANGGKMIIFDSTADPVFSPYDKINWLKDVENTTGDSASFVRLFVIPGMTHCGDGDALDDFDPLTALENWHEGGQAPDALPAKGSHGRFAEKSQPICAYPKSAYYEGGDENAAASFVCR